VRSAIGAGLAVGKLREVGVGLGVGITPLGVDPAIAPEPSPITSDATTMPPAMTSRRRIQVAFTRLTLCL
jgi:hypothetical protein